HEKYHVRLAYCRFGFRSHATGKTFGHRLFKSRCINHCKLNITKPTLPFAPVARDTGLIIDQGQMPAHKPVKQRWFSVNRPTHNGNCEVHSLPLPSVSRQSIKIIPDVFGAPITFGSSPLGIARSSARESSGLRGGRPGRRSGGLPLRRPRRRLGVLL